MKKLPRWAKILICLTLITVSCSMLYAYLPSATPQIAFRRMERSEMIGPSKIIATLDVPYGWYEGTVLGKSSYGYTVFSWRNQYDRGSMTYLEREADVTLLYPEVSGSSWYAVPNWQLPIFAFTELPAADHAELILYLTNQEGESSEYRLTARFQEGGYAVFYLNGEVIDSNTMGELLTVASPNYIVPGRFVGKATVYDCRGKILATAEQDFDRSPWSESAQ